MASQHAQFPAANLRAWVQMNSLPSILCSAPARPRCQPMNIWDKCSTIDPMTTDNRIVFNSLDLEAEIDISQRNLPHWFQAGAATFVTFRIADSIFSRRETDRARLLGVRQRPETASASSFGTVNINRKPVASHAIAGVAFHPTASSANATRPHRDREFAWPS